MARATDEIDGRRLRREQNRQAVLEALATLFREGIYQPSMAEVAGRAGLSPRSLFRYFDDVDDLLRAAIESQLAAAAPLVEIGVGRHDPLADRIAGIVSSRVRLWEAVGPAARAVRAAASRQPIVADQLHQSRRYLRNQLAELFSAELVAPHVLPAIDALCSFETYELLRMDHDLSVEDTTAVLMDALGTILHVLSPVE